MRLSTVLSLLLLVPSVAAAQQEIPNDRKIELQLFQPAPGSQTFLTVGDAELLSPKRFQAGFGITYLTGGLTVYNVDAMDNLTGERTNVVSSILAGQLTGAYGLTDKMQLGAALPIVFAMSGEGLDPSTAMPAPDGLAVTGSGDLTLEFGYKFWTNGALTASALPQVTVPTSFGSGESAFLGDDLPSLRPRAALLWSSADGRFSAGGNLGFIFRKPRTIYSSEIGQQITYGAAGLFRINDRFEVVAELFGRNGFNTDLNASPLEADGAFRIDVNNAIAVTVGGGAGLIQGIGSPGFRAFALVSWSPDIRDSDLDGIANHRDKCPFQAEDKDGFQDGDGCIEGDNDKDLIEDADDKCKGDAEDKDGFQDDDGCPEPDNDLDGFLDEKDTCPDDAEDKLAPFDKDGCPATKRDSDDDGVADATDTCPTEFEDKDGFEDDNGCPDPDNDQDGVLDENDQTCLNDAEDKDNFQDDDGCPEPDNDLDGFLDGKDRCPDERETVNGVKDGDGCPDGGGKVLARMDGARLDLKDKIVFEGARIKSKSHGMLEQAALVMRGEPNVTKWRIVIAAEKQKTDEATRELSQKRADALVAFLVKEGVPAERLEAVGVVGDRPTTAIVALERTDAAPPDPEEPPPADPEPEIVQ
jgi:outer membrane protein OmpA-like peptidoglycan-associated protein